MAGIREYRELTVAVRDSESEVGECPVFDFRTGRLAWVDSHGCKIYEGDPSAGTHTATDVDAMVAAVAPRDDRDGFVVAVADGFGFFVDGKLDLVDEVLPEPRLRMNGAKVDSRGRFWAGSSDVALEPGRGRLHRWDGEAPSVVVAAGLVLPDGIGWDADDTTMYLADSYVGLVYAAPFHAETGDIGRLDAVIDVEGPGVPDGLSVDVDGCVWVAMHGGGQVCRYDPAGRLIGVVPVPVCQPSGCAFGADGRLYITSARTGLTAEELARQPLSGSVFAVETDTAGVDVSLFRA